MISIRPLLFVITIFLLLITGSCQVDCWNDSNMPKILGSDASQTPAGDSKYVSVIGNSVAIFLGGWTADSNLHQLSKNGAVITRLSNKYRTLWSMQYVGQASDDYIEMVGALALSPDDSKLAAYAFRFDRTNPFKGTA